jgi:RNA polymerase sigma-70 factor, ECF subfamily
MAALCGGERSALAELVQRYQNDILRFCLHYVRDVERAKEMGQETFVRVYTARKRFDPARKFRPWILCIARNLCLNEIKRKKLVHMESLEEYASAARMETGELLNSAADSPDLQLAAAERRAMLDRALNTLDEESRQIVVLRFFERMSARDIAQTVGSTEGAVRTRLHRILKLLRKRFQACRDIL